MKTPNPVLLTLALATIAAATILRAADPPGAANGKTRWFQGNFADYEQSIVTEDPERVTHRRSKYKRLALRRGWETRGEGQGKKE